MTTPPIESFLSMSGADLTARFARGVENFDARALKLTDDQLDTAFLEGAASPSGRALGRWPARVLLGHLADAELVFVARMRQVIGEERPVFCVWDENSFIDAGIYRGAQHPPAAFVAVVHTLRKWHTEFLRSLKEQQFERKALHPVRGEQTLKTVLAYDTWHLEHHAEYLNAKVEKFLGARAA